MLITKCSGCGHEHVGTGCSECLCQEFTARAEDEDAMTRPPMVTDRDAAEWANDPALMHLTMLQAIALVAERNTRLLADRAELWEFVKLVRNTGAQHCMPLAEKLLERKEEAGRDA